LPELPVFEIGFGGFLNPQHPGFQADGGLYGTVLALPATSDMVAACNHIGHLP
jgi:hypothetical protein